MATKYPFFCTFSVMSPGTGDGSVRDWDHSGTGLDRYANTVFRYGFVPTLFVSGECARAHAPMLDEYRARGAEIGLFVAPNTTLDAKKSRQMGLLDHTEQLRVFHEGLNLFQYHLGFRPTAVRTGLYSANAATYAVAKELFFTHICTRLPGAQLPVIGVTWPIEQNIMSREDLIDIPVTANPDEKLFNRFPLYLAAEIGGPDKHQALLQIGRNAGHVCVSGGTNADYWDGTGTSLRQLETLLESVMDDPLWYAATISEYRLINA
jgi:hypothetical protein